jgi:peptidoglycan/xylan/chitin deacetylase (PgdA/CDA1 family)
MLRRSAAVALAALVLGGCGTGVGHKHHGAGAAKTHTHTTTTPVVTTTTTPVAPTTTTRRATTKRVRNATPQASWRPYTGPVPILVYHALGPPPAGAPFPGLYVSYGDFKAEMAWLHAHGYQAVTLDEIMNAWYHGGTLPSKPIVITFDNGYPEQVTFAPHVMARYGWPGVLNEITENHLKPRQIWPIIHMGWEVDSHSLTHPDLTDISATDLRAQVVESRRYLQRTFHIPVNSFCYPSSRYDDAVIAAVKAAGYTNAVTEGHAYATSTDPYLLPRFEIEGGVSDLAADLLQDQPSTYGQRS